jgi:transposase
VWLERGASADDLKSDMPTAVIINQAKGDGQVAVMIGIDPHKGSHTAAAIDEAETALGELRIRSGATQLERLLEWAGRFPERTFAVEGAGGLGYLLAQQLVSVGERVLDVQPKLAARVRLLATGDTNKNDPNDARSVAIAALRSPAVRMVHPEDHAQVMKVWAKRQRNLGSARTQVVCRLHAVLCELTPGGVSGQLHAPRAARLLEELEPEGAVASARHELALDLLEDLRRIDEQMSETKKRIAAAVTASKTTLTEIFGVGPIVAATVIGDVVDVSRFANRDHFASYNGTAPIEVSPGPRKVYRLSRRGNRRLNHAIHMAAVTQVRHATSEGRAYYDRKLAEGKTGKEALRSLKRRISDAVFARLQADAHQLERSIDVGSGGQEGNDSVASAAGSHPEHRLFDTATPEPDITLKRPAAPRRRNTTSTSPKKERRAS